MNDKDFGQCVHRSSFLKNGQIVYGDRCTKTARTKDYEDEGRYEYPVCIQHSTQCGRGAFKGPEDY